jgi:hypothetical protein
VAEREGDLAAAGRLCQESLALYRELRLADGIAACLRTIGHLALQQQEWDAARAVYEESLALLEELGNKVRVGAAQRDLALVACARRDWVEARARIEESLALFRQVGGQIEAMGCLETLAEIVGGEGEAERGARLLGAAEALSETVDRPRWPVERHAYERGTAALRAVLGEAAFAAARAEGRTLTLDQAIDLAPTGKTGA